MIKIVDQDALETAMASVKGYVDERYVKPKPIYNVNTVIDFGGSTSMSSFSFNDDDIPTLNSMLIAVKDHWYEDAPVEGIFTFVNFSDINGRNVSTPVPVKTTSVWYDEEGHFNCAFLLCGKVCTLISEFDFLEEITGGMPFMITLE